MRNAETSVAAEPNVAEEDDYDPVAEKAKMRAMIHRMYGLTPDEEPVTGSNTKDQNKNNPQISQIDAEAKTEAEESATETSEGTESETEQQPEEAVEALEEDQQRKHQEEYDRMWEARRRRIREGN